MTERIVAEIVVVLFSAMGILFTVTPLVLLFSRGVGDGPQNLLLVPVGYFFLVVAKIERKKIRLGQDQKK